jgi:RNA polymerase sigma factor (sigma-70 family)
VQAVEDERLIKRIKTDACNDSLNELIRRHSGLCYKVISKYFAPVQSKGKNYQDLVANKDYFVYKAALSYNLERKTKFSTWLGNYVRYKCLDFLNESNFFSIAQPQEALNQINKKTAASFEDEFSLRRKKECVFDALLELKDQRIPKIYSLRYFTTHPKMTWKKIGEKIGVSTQTVINLHEKGKKMVKIKVKNF